MPSREERKERTARLKQMREEHAVTVATTQTRLKQQQALRKQLRAALHDGARTVPELAAACSLPTEEVLWHVTAMRKYDELVEAGMDGAYYRYALAEEKSS